MSVVHETRQTRTRDDRTQSGRRSRVGAADTSGRARSASAQRALDRRRKRLANAAHTGASPERDFRPLAQRISLPSTSPVALARRIPFVFLVIGMLVLGLALTLWLSTTAAQNSYQLSAAKQTNQDLQNRLQQIKKTYESGQSAPELAKRATDELGMIPAANPPRLVVGPDGKVRVVGDVKPAQGPPAPSMDPGNSGAVNPGVNQQNKPAPSNNNGIDPNAPAAAVPNFSNVLPGAAAPAPAGQPAAPAGQPSAPAGQTPPAAGQSPAPAPAAQAPQQISPQTGGAPTANSPVTP